MRKKQSFFLRLLRLLAAVKIVRPSRCAAIDLLGNMICKAFILSKGMFRLMLGAGAALRRGF
jgi:hypothetical protein